MHILFFSCWFPTRNNPNNGDFVKRHAQSVALIYPVTVLHIENDATISKKEIVNSRLGNYNERIVYVPKTKFSLLNLLLRYYHYQIEVQKIPKFDLIHANILYYDTLWVYFRTLFYKEKYVITEHWTNYNTPKSYFSTTWLWIA